MDSIFLCCLSSIFTTIRGSAAHVTFTHSHTINEGADLSIRRDTLLSAQRGQWTNAVNVQNLKFLQHVYTQQTLSFVFYPFEWLCCCPTVRPAIFGWWTGLSSFDWAKGNSLLLTSSLELYIFHFLVEITYVLALLISCTYIVHPPCLDWITVDTFSCLNHISSGADMSK